MKLAHFNALCAREWDKPRRGNVVSMRLTPASAAELAVDVLTSPNPVTLMLTGMTRQEAAEIRAGAGITRIPNPITRTTVRIITKQGGDRDTARVSVMGGTYRQTWWAA